jgi:hypothetical protein
MSNLELINTILADLEESQNPIFQRVQISFDRLKKNNNNFSPKFFQILCKTISNKLVVKNDHENIGLWIGSLIRYFSSENGKFFFFQQEEDETCKIAFANMISKICEFSSSKMKNELMEVILDSENIDIEEFVKETYQRSKREIEHEKIFVNFLFLDVFDETARMLTEKNVNSENDDDANDESIRLKTREFVEVILVLAEEEKCVELIKNISLLKQVLMN